MNFIRRQRMANRDITILAHRDFIAPMPDSILLNLSNVSDESGMKSRRTLFGPLLEQPRGSGSFQNKKPLPVEKKAIPADIVQTWVERSKDVSLVPCISKSFLAYEFASLHSYSIFIFSWRHWVCRHFSLARRRQRFKRLSI